MIEKHKTPTIFKLIFPLCDKDYMFEKIDRFVELGENDNAQSLNEIHKLLTNLLDQNNKINRDLLRTKIFIDSEKKDKLEAIIHPIVKEEIAKFIAKSESIYKIIIVPLIFETNSQDFYDKIIVIDCDEDIQIKRASQRDNKSREDIINIMKNQVSREERKSIADNIILNNSTLNHLKENILKTHQRLLGININE